MPTRKIHMGGKSLDETQARQEKTRDTPEGQALREADTLYEKRKEDKK